MNTGHLSSELLFGGLSFCDNNKRVETILKNGLNPPLGEEPLIYPVFWRGLSRVSSDLVFNLVGTFSGVTLSSGV